MVVDARIKPLPVSEFTHKQPDVDILKGALMLRWVVSAPSGGSVLHWLIAAKCLW